jgi:hypothetical protein
VRPGLVTAVSLLPHYAHASSSRLRRARPVNDPGRPGQFLANGTRAKSALNRSVSDAAWGRFVSAPRAKAEEQQWRIAPRKRDFVAAHTYADMLPEPTNTPRVASSGLDWPFACKPREKKPAARVAATASPDPEPLRREPGG